MALSRHHAAISKPMGVEEIVELAQQFEFGPNRPLKGWLRSAQMLLTESAICEQDGNLQMAYLYLYRHAALVLGKFPQHPEYKDPKLKAELALAQRAVQRNLAKLEQWKPKIKLEHERYRKAVERRDAERQRIRDERDAITKQSLPYDSRHIDADRYDDDTIALDDDTQTLDANEHRDLAVGLAHQELRRRDASRQSTRQAGLSPTTVAARRRGLVLDPTEAADYQPHDSVQANDGVHEVGRYLQNRTAASNEQTLTMGRDNGLAGYQYPTVPTKEDAITWRSSLMSNDLRPLSDHRPALPAKGMPNGSSQRPDPSLPAVPHKSHGAMLSGPTSSAALTANLAQASTSKYTFKPNAFSESGAPLRTLLLPPDLRTAFLNLAHPNTARNFETCGILCGTLISNALFINHLVIPDQKSTSDTCDTTEEGDNELFDFCDGNDLLVCGWIHTHPSQTCFLSSRDLHTSSGYQVMLPEAIAIVCAPRQNPDWGIFRLTDPPGLSHILNCQQRSLFHPHSETNLYTDAVKPGHVVEGPGLKFEVVDLRK